MFISDSVVHEVINTFIVVCVVRFVGEKKIATVVKIVSADMPFVYCHPIHTFLSYRSSP